MSGGDAAVRIHPASTGADFDTLRTLFLAYAESLGFSLCFQGFDREIADLASHYGAPGGAIFLAERDGAACGCVGVRRFAEGIAELKRMYVPPGARRGGIGRALLERALAFARGAGYGRIRLDTLETMTAAIALYERYGFARIPPYRDNPIAGARYYERAIAGEPGDTPA